MSVLTRFRSAMTGIMGATIGTRIFQGLGIRDDSIKGIAMRVTSHGIGTARAFQVSLEMGAFSGFGHGFICICVRNIIALAVAAITPGGDKATI